MQYRGRKRITTRQIEEALKKCGGFQSLAAKQLGISQQAISKRVLKNKRLQAVIKEADEFYIDLGVSKLIKAIEAGEPWAIRFFLEYKGRDRGFVRQVQHSSDDNFVIKVRYID
jgi:hypothetical protein